MPEVWIIQKVRKLKEPESNTPSIQVRMISGYRFNINKILTPMGDRLHNDEVFWTRDAECNRAILNCLRPGNHFFLERHASEGEIDLYSVSREYKRHDAVLPGGFRQTAEKRLESGM